MDVLVPKMGFLMKVICKCSMLPFTVSAIHLTEVSTGSLGCSAVDPAVNNQINQHPTILSKFDLHRICVLSCIVSDGSHGTDDRIVHRCLILGRNYGFAV